MSKTSLSSTFMVLHLTRSTSTKSCGVEARKLLNRPMKPGCALPLAAEIGGLRFQGLQVGVAGAFEHQLEAAGVAEAIDGRRPEDEDLRLSISMKSWPRSVVGDRLGVQFRRAAFVERLQDDERRSRSSS